MTRIDTEALRRVVAAQTSVSASIEALMHAVGSIIGTALDEGNVQPINDLLKHMDDTPTGWSDAVLANTKQAGETARFVDMPGYVQEAFKAHADRVQRERGQQQDQETHAHRQAQQPEAHREPATGHDQPGQHGQTAQDKAKK